MTEFNPKTSIFFPGLKESDKDLAIELVSQFGFTNLKSFDKMEKNSQNLTSKVIGVSIGESSMNDETDIDEIIDNLKQIRIISLLATSDDSRYLEFTVCKENEIEKVLDNLKTRTLKLTISAPKKPDIFPSIKQIVPNFFQQRYGIPLPQSYVDDNEKTKISSLIIDFETDVAKQLLIDLTCTCFFGTYLKVVLNSFADRNQITEKPKEMREKLYKTLGDDGVRMSVRKDFGEYINNENNYDISQVKALMPTETNMSTYNRLYGLLFLLFQFPKLKSDQFMVFVEKYDNQANGSIIGTITINPGLSEQDQEQAENTIQESFKSISIMRLTGFCVKVSSEPVVYRFATSWCNKMNNNFSGKAIMPPH